MDEFGNMAQPPENNAVEAARLREQTQESSSGSLKAGDVEATFEVMEGAPYDRSQRWVWSMLLVVLVLVGVAFGLDGWNSLPMALAFVALIAVYGITMRRSDPKRSIPLTFTEFGMQLAGRFYAYTQFQYFYIVEFPDYVMFTLHRESRMTTGVEVYLRKDGNIEGLRTFLQERIPENIEAKETYVQKLIRLLQL